MKGKKINQINNLVIYQDTNEKINYFGTIIDNPNFGKCSVWKKDGSACLETRLSLEQAEEFCHNTKDFVVNSRKLEETLDDATQRSKKQNIDKNKSDVEFEKE